MADKPSAFSTVVTTGAGTSLVVGGADGAATTGTGNASAGTFTGQLLAPAGIAVDGATAGTHGIQFPNSGATPGVVAHNLYSPDGVSMWFNGSQLATGAAVSGTPGQLCKFSGTSTISDSITSESGTTQTLIGQYKIQSGLVPGLTVGADNNARTLTNNTLKAGILAVPHYANASNPLFLIGAQNSNGANTLLIGGGITGLNAASTVSIYTGATTTTDTGTLRWTVDASGNLMPTGTVTIGVTGTRIYQGWFADLTVTNAIAGSITGASTSCSGNAATATTAGTVTGATQASITSAANLATVGTITSGIWNAGAVTTTGPLVTINGTTDATFIANGNPASGGVGMRLQNATANKWRLAMSGSNDLTIFGYTSAVNAVTFADATGNTAIGGTLTVNGFGTHSFSAGSNGSNWLAVVNTGHGTAARSIIESTAYTTNFYIETQASDFTTSGSLMADGTLLYQSGAGGLNLQAANASGAIRFYSGGATLRWGILAAGDLTFGGSSHIALSAGTPTAGTNCTGVTGTDYAFTSNIKNNSAPVTVNFGHTWTNPPICVGVTEYSVNPVCIDAVTTTYVRFFFNGPGMDSIVYMHCIGY